MKPHPPHFFGARFTPPPGMAARLGVAAALTALLAMGGAWTLTAQQEEAAATPAERMATLQKRAAEQPRPDTWFELGHLQFTQGDVHGGFVSLARAVSLAPVGHYSQTYLLHQLDKSPYRFDLSLHEDLLTILPEFPPLLERLGRLYQGKKGMEPKAEKLFAQWARLRPENPEAHARLAEFYRATGRAGEALPHLEKVRALSGESAYALRRLGTLQRELGHLDASASALETAIELPDLGPDRVAQLELGHTRMAQKRPKEAAAAFRAAIQVDPGSATTHLFLGQALTAAGDGKGAMAAFAEALRHDTRLQEAHLDLGRLLLAQGDARGALPHFREASSINDRDPDLHFLVGETALKAGDVALARRELEKLRNIGGVTLAHKLDTLIGAQAPATP
ncbi:MAG: tetratricopeptide repeat protein [Nitrospirota bacterium]|nr:tetratricopeptide repeat protein [Nitrospirota bacterium]